MCSNVTLCHLDRHIGMKNKNKTPFLKNVVQAPFSFTHITKALVFGCITFEMQDQGSDWLTLSFSRHHITKCLSFQHINNITGERGKTFPLRRERIIVLFSFYLSNPKRLKISLAFQHRSSLTR